MNKEVVVEFDKDAYESYQELQNSVMNGQSSSQKPTYSQLLSSINNAIQNIKADPHFGDLIPRKYISRDMEQIKYSELNWWDSGDYYIL